MDSFRAPTGQSPSVPTDHPKRQGLPPYLHFRSVARRPTPCRNRGQERSGPRRIAGESARRCPGISGVLLRPHCGASVRCSERDCVRRYRVPWTGTSGTAVRRPDHRRGRSVAGTGQAVDRYNLTDRNGQLLGDDQQLDSGTRPACGLTAPSDVMLEAMPVGWWLRHEYIGLQLPRVVATDWAVAR